ncbi:hypothetical protein VKT23_006228 [Stygiomarasmius scandens]|uniref:Uncharacterized protein n=1 Tax=Marasmiellus scandens TaxID=2682957 RepID=A0ABR1JSV7_9AGAR
MAVPPYMEHPRQTYSDLLATSDYNETSTFDVDIAEDTQNVSVVLKYIISKLNPASILTQSLVMVWTHVVDRRRLIGLVSQRSTLSSSSLGHPLPIIYSPGPTCVFVVVGGVPSFGHRTMVGAGAQPPLDEVRSRKKTILYH